MPLCRDLKGVTAREAEFRSITSGHRLVSRRVGGFQLTETRHSAGSILQKHSHGDASVNFVIAGRLRETVGDVARRREYDCDAGSLLYKQPDEYHANVYGPEGARCLIIQPSAESLRALADAGHRADGNPFPLDPRPAQIAGRIYAQMASPLSRCCRAVIGGDQYLRGSREPEATSPTIVAKELCLET